MPRKYHQGQCRNCEFFFLTVAGPCCAAPSSRTGMPLVRFIGGEHTTRKCESFRRGRTWTRTTTTTLSREA